MSAESLEIHVIADSTGETAEYVALAAISQFDTDFSKIVRYRYVEGPGKIDEIVSRAADVPSLIVCTLVVDLLYGFIDPRVKLEG